MKVIKGVESMKAEKINQSKNKKTEKIPVCAYARVSTDSADQENSLTTQIDYWKKRLGNSEKYELKRVFSDSAISGTTDKRPEFQEMIQRALQGEYKMIFTKSISRFTRNIADLLKYSEMLKEKGVNVRFDEENLELLQSGTSLLLTILGTISQIEVENTSNHVRHTIIKKMNEGKPVGQQDPFGYDWKDGKLVINEEQAKWVKYIFEKYLEGYGCRSIANHLTHLGIKTKNHLKRPIEKQSKWHDSTIREILSNEKYIGNLNQNKTITIKSIGRVRAKNKDGKLYPAKNTHPAIIDEDTFYKVQEKLKEKAEKYTNLSVRNDGKSPTSYPFTGKLICRYCGENLIRHKNNTKSVWGCRTYFKEGKRYCPNSKPIQESILEESVIASINQMMGDNYLQIKEKTLTDIIKSSERKDKPLKDELKRYKSALKKNTQKIDYLVESFVLKDITKSEYQKLREKYEKEKEEIEKNIDRVEKILADNKVVLEKESTLIKKIKSYDPEAFDRNIFDGVIEYMTIGALNDPHFISAHFRSNVLTDIFGGSANETITENSLTPETDKMLLVSIVEEYFGIAGFDEILTKRLPIIVYEVIREVLGKSKRKLKTSERNFVISTSIQRIKEEIPQAKNYTKPIPIIEEKKIVSDNGTTHVECVVGMTKGDIH